MIFDLEILSDSKTSIKGVSDFLFQATVKDVIYKLLHDDEFADEVTINIKRSL